MRVALVIYGSLDTVSGGYLYDRKIVEGLRRAGHRVEIVSLPWRSYPRHLLDNLSNAWIRRLRDLRVDVILQDELNHPSLAWSNSRAFKRNHPPIVPIVHHLRSSEGHLASMRPLYRAIEKRYLSGVDGMVCNSRTTLTSVEDLSGPARRALVLFPCGDHVLDGGFLSLHEIPTCESPLSIVSVGNLILRKGMHVVVRALPLMRFPAMLAIAGSDAVDPTYTRRLRALVLQLGLTARVHFHGAVTNRELARLYASNQVMALPSYEGFGIVYLEAMAFGRPVIASTAGAAREIVTDGVEGFLVPPEDPIALAERLDRLASDANLLHTMGENARARFDRHPTWAQAGEQLSRWLEEWVP